MEPEFPFRTLKPLKQDYEKLEVPVFPGISPSSG